MAPKTQPQHATRPPKRATGVPRIAMRWQACGMLRLTIGTLLLGQVMTRPLIGLSPNMGVSVDPAPRLSRHPRNGLRTALLRPGPLCLTGPGPPGTGRKL